MDTYDEYVIAAIPAAQQEFIARHGGDGISFERRNESIAHIACDIADAAYREAGRRIAARLKNRQFLRP